MTKFPYIPLMLIISPFDRYTAVDFQTYPNPIMEI